jgi:hypothetical protein
MIGHVLHCRPAVIFFAIVTIPRNDGRRQGKGHLRL